MERDYRYIKKILGLCERNSYLEKVQARRVTCESKFDPLLFLSKDLVMQLQCIWANVLSWHGRVFVAGDSCRGSCCEKSSGAASLSDIDSFSWFQDRPTGGQNGVSWWQHFSDKPCRHSGQWRRTEGGAPAQEHMFHCSLWVGPEHGPGGSCSSWVTCWNRLLLWRGPVLEQCLKKCSLWEAPAPEKIVKDLTLK